MLKICHILLVHFAALGGGRKTDISTLKKERGGLFSKCCTKSFKAKFLCYTNEVLFEMVKTALNNTYLVSMLLMELIDSGGNN